jgi:hypothetical protein
MYTIQETVLMASSMDITKYGSIEISEKNEQKILFDLNLVIQNDKLSQFETLNALFDRLDMLFWRCSLSFF